LLLLGRLLLPLLKLHLTRWLTSLMVWRQGLGATLEELHEFTVLFGQCAARSCIKARVKWSSTFDDAILELLELPTA
jgi:hypothetical protein